MRFVPENAPDHLNALLAGIQGKGFGNGLAHGFHFPAVDLRQFPQGGIGHGVGGGAGAAGHAVQIGADTGFVQGFFLLTKGGVTADDIFYISILVL